MEHLITDIDLTTHVSTIVQIPALKMWSDFFHFHSKPVNDNFSIKILKASIMLRFVNWRNSAVEKNNLAEFSWTEKFESLTARSENFCQWSEVHLVPLDKHHLVRLPEHKHPTVEENRSHKPARRKSIPESSTSIVWNF